MSERRRMMMWKPELITDGLQFWFDGKNNQQGGGFNQSATKWYPFMKNSAIPNSYCLSKKGTGTWNSNGGFIASGSYGYFESTGISPFYYLPNVYNFTFVICLGNYTDWNNSYFCPCGGRSSSGSGDHRWLAYYNGNGRITFGVYSNKWLDGEIERRTPVGTPIRTITIVRNGSNITYYVNGNYDNSFIATDEYLGKISGICFSLGSYDGTSNPKITAPYYSCQMYNRALSEREIVKAHKFITNRYGI